MNFVMQHLSRLTRAPAGRRLDAECTKSFSVARCSWAKKAVAGHYRLGFGEMAFAN
jgi:hypothetical protein